MPNIINSTINAVAPPPLPAPRPEREPVAASRDLPVFIQEPARVPGLLDNMPSKRNLDVGGPVLLRNISRCDPERIKAKHSDVQGKCIECAIPVFFWRKLCPIC